MKCVNRSQPLERIHGTVSSQPQSTPEMQIFKIQMCLHRLRQPHRRDRKWNGTLSRLGNWLWEKITKMTKLPYTRTNVDPLSLRCLSPFLSSVLLPSTISSHLSSTPLLLTVFSYNTVIMILWQLSSVVESSASCLNG